MRTFRTRAMDADEIYCWECGAVESHECSCEGARSDWCGEPCHLCDDGGITGDGKLCPLCDAVPGS
jgi:hypothetical protein